MPENPNQGICVFCTHYHEKDKGDPKYVCKAPRRGGFDWVKGDEWEDEIDCYKVNTGPSCQLWEEAE